MTTMRLPELRSVNADKCQNKKHFLRALTLKEMFVVEEKEI